MKFLVLVYQDESIWANATPAEQDQYYREHDAFSEAVKRAPVTLLAGEALLSVTHATTLRRRGDQLAVTDGPFAETAEQLGGFYLLDAPDLDTVTELVRELPEYTLEIRPVADM